MIGSRSSIRLLIDINVPDEVGDLFIERGHDVLLVRNELGPQATDSEIVRRAGEFNASILTWDKDFSRLISRAAIGTRQRYRHAGRLSSAGVRYGFARRRTEILMPSIEFEFSVVQRQRDQRLIMTIRRESFTIER